MSSVGRRKMKIIYESLLSGDHKRMAQSPEDSAAIAVAGFIHSNWTNAPAGT